MRHLLKISAILSLAVSLTYLTACSKNEQHPDNDNTNIGALDIEAEQSPTYHFLAGEVALDRNNYQEALVHYLWLTKHMDDPVFAARATSIALEVQNYQAAAETGKVWAEKMPHDLQTQAIAASLMLKAGCTSCAQPYLKALLVQSDMETMQYLAQVYGALDDQDSQQRYVTLLDQLGHNNKDARALFMEADLQYKLGDNIAANKTIDSILAVKPNWMRAQALRIQMLYESGKKQEAYSYLNGMLEKDPHNPALKWLYAKMSVEMGQMDKGLAILKTITKDPSYGNEATLELTKQYIQLGKFAEARIYADAYQTKNPGSDEGYFLLGFIAQETNQLPEAIAAYEKVKGGLYYLNARVQMVLCETKQGKISAALAETDRLAEQFPEESERIALVRAQVLLDSNQYTEAYETLTDIINSDAHTNVELYYVRGLVAIEINNISAAAKDFKYVLSKNPQHIQTLNAFTQLLIDEDKLDEAQVYNDQAARVAPNNPDTLDNTGWLKFKRGQLDDAVPYLLKAYKTASSPAHAAHLGEVLWQKGNEAEAVAVWNHGLEQDPNNAVLLNYMKTHLVHPAAAK